MSGMTVPTLRSGVRLAPAYQSWEEVARELGRLLREAKFESFLAREESTDSPPDGP